MNTFLRNTISTLNTILTSGRLLQTSKATRVLLNDLIRDISILVMTINGNSSTILSINVRSINTTSGNNSGSVLQTLMSITKDTGILSSTLLRGNSAITSNRYLFLVINSVRNNSTCTFLNITSSTTRLSARLYIRVKGQLVRRRRVQQSSRYTDRYSALLLATKGLI